MGRRALIIGIEDYSAVIDGSIATKLEDTLKSAEKFREWLIEKWDAEHVPEEERQIIFCSAPSVTNGRGATAEDITQALLDLKAAGQNATDEFFFYFSGHGFSFVEPDARSDVLIASNYKSMQLSGSACMKLDKAIYWLRQHLGIGHQYYFVDACRNDLDGSQINPGGIIPPSKPQASGEATTYLLQSTAPAATAAVDGRFAIALIDGLHGKGTAKTWDETDDDTMVVRFDTLRVFVRDRMTAQRVHNNVAGSDGETDGILARFKPAPPSNCTVRISGATPTAGTISSIGKRNPSRQDTPIAGAVTTIVLKPDRYRIEVSIADSILQDNVRDIVVFDDTELTFDRPAPGWVARLDVPDVTAEVLLPKNLTVELHDLATGSRQVFRGADKATLPHGNYATVLKDTDRGVLKSDELTVDAGTSAIGDWNESLPHISIAQHFPVDHGSIMFSESIGPLADPDLAMWLAILGGGRIMFGTGGTDYSKIANFPLHNFQGEAPTFSCVYLLAGLEDPAADLQVMVSGDRERSWLSASSPQGLQAIRECVIPTDESSPIVSLRLNGGPATSLISKTFAGFVTLLTVTFGSDGRPIVSQYVLPLASHLKSLGPVPRNMLQDIRALAEAQRAYRHRRDLRKIPYFWEAVRDPHWMEPIGTAMAAYELFRRGASGEQSELLLALLARLDEHFVGFPDTEALLALSGQPVVPLPGPPPLFLDGLRATPTKNLPFPETRLDYDSPWCAWRGVVS